MFDEETPLDAKLDHTSEAEAATESELPMLGEHDRPAGSAHYLAKWKVEAVSVNYLVLCQRECAARKPSRPQVVSGAKAEVYNGNAELGHALGKESFALPESNRNLHAEPHLLGREVTNQSFDPANSSAPQNVHDGWVGALGQLPRNGVANPIPAYPRPCSARKSR
jgi:hypothetical protein